MATNIANQPAGSFRFSNALGMPTVQQQTVVTKTVNEKPQIERSAFDVLKEHASELKAVKFERVKSLDTAGNRQVAITFPTPLLTYVKDRKNIEVFTAVVSKSVEDVVAITSAATIIKSLADPKNRDIYMRAFDGDDVCYLAYPEISTIATEDCSDLAKLFA